MVFGLSPNTMFSNIIWHVADQWSGTCQKTLCFPTLFDMWPISDLAHVRKRYVFQHYLTCGRSVIWHMSENVCFPTLFDMFWHVADQWSDTCQMRLCFPRAKRCVFQGFLTHVRKRLFSNVLRHLSHRMITDPPDLQKCKNDMFTRGKWTVVNLVEKPGEIQWNRSTDWQTDTLTEILHGPAGPLYARMSNNFMHGCPTTSFVQPFRGA